MCMDLADAIMLLFVKKRPKMPKPDHVFANIPYNKKKGCCLNV